LTIRSDYTLAEPYAQATARGFARRLLDVILYLTILSSPFVFIEPSPYEVFVGLLGIACLAAGVHIDRRLAPLLVLLLLINAGGALALMPVMHDPVAVKYMAVTFALSMTTLVFACVLIDDTMHRLSIIRRVYIVAAVICALIGIAGYLKLVPGAEIFTLYGRARGTFKDPNVYGPFLILPLLFVISAVVSHGMKLRHVVAGCIIFVGLFFSFSRAAWGHTVVSAMLMLALMFLTSATAHLRFRIVAYSISAVAGAALLIVGLLSVSAIGDLFKERAAITKEYDIGEQGRFGRHKRSIPVLLQSPNGLGPDRFHLHFGEASHQTYLNGFSAYGWLGGTSVIVLVVLTLMMGFRFVIVRTPWQPYFIAIYATYVGEMLIGFVIDTDHWRHYYLLMGAIWGLAIATARTRRRIAAQPLY
jgi:hypothetical protein